jgi:hypothetical protein
VIRNATKDFRVNGMTLAGTIYFWKRSAGWLGEHGIERSGVRIPAGSRFSAHVHTGPGVHPASNTMGTGAFPGVKRPGHGADHLPQSSAEVKGRVELYLYSPCGPS